MQKNRRSNDNKNPLVFSQEEAGTFGRARGAHLAEAEEFLHQRGRQLGAASPDPPDRGGLGSPFIFITCFPSKNGSRGGGGIDRRERWELQPPVLVPLVRPSALLADSI